MKPILFSTEMVRALLGNRKTVTRRVVKGAGADWDFVGIEERPYERRVKADGMEYPKELDWPHAVFSAGDSYCDYPMIKAPYRPGDILYVRETWCKSDCFGLQDGYVYKSNDNSILEYTGFTPKWRPSIHMPREAARIFLRVRSVSVERLQESFFTPGVTVFACQAEGIDIGDQCRECLADYGNPVCIDENDNDDDAECECGILDGIRAEFADLWDSTIKPADRALYGWEANPWVWVITFERISREEAGL